MSRLQIPNDWQQEDGYLTVLFCIPDSQRWRGLITAYIESLTYGWTWDEQTGTIKDAQERGREIFNSMQLCDLQTDLDRLADALEVVANWDDAITAISQALVTMSQCQTCGQNPCHCNPEVSGPAGQETVITLSPCCPPEGFSTFAAFETYVCAVANFVIDYAVTITKQLELLHNRFYYDYIQLNAQNRLSVTEVYQKIAVALPELIGDQWLFTVPNEDRAELITELTDRYVQFQQDVIDLVPEVQTLQQTIDHYYTDTFGPPVANLQLNADQAKQDLYGADTTASAMTVLTNFLAAAAATAGGYLPAQLANIYNLLETTGIINQLFRKNTQIETYNGSYVCTGTKCTCTRVTMLVGVDNGNENYSSQFSGGWDQVQVAYYLESNPPAVYCGPSMTVEIQNLTGWQASGVGNDFQVIRQNGTFAYQGDVPWPSTTEGAQFLIRSNGAFSVDYIASEVC